MRAIWMSGAIAGLSAFAIGCNTSKEATQAQTQRSNRPTAVDVAIASYGKLSTEREYTGTTVPLREVAVKSRLEGRLLNLNVDVGDRVERGQIIARLDDAVVAANVLQADAEVAARQAEVAQAQAAVKNALTQVERAQLQYQQAQTDALRFTQLSQQGVVSRQTAENAIAQARTAEQAVRSAQQQVNLQQQAVKASQQRVAAQIALKSSAKERQSYTTITAPIEGVVLSRVSETGNLLFAGNEVIKLGDFSQVKVIVQVSELEIDRARNNRSVKVRFDSFPNREFIGMVRRISPVADPVTRLIPVEVVLPNPQGQLGSGQLARVKFEERQAAQIVIAETALTAGRKAPTARLTDRGNGEGQTGNLNRPQEGSVFLMRGDRQAARVAARPVTWGTRHDGKVSILSGLAPGDRVVIKSGGKLQDGDKVRVSATSNLGQ